MRYGDCADWITEQLAEPIVLTVRGRDWTFPGATDDLPVAKGLQLLQYQQAIEANLDAVKRGEPADLDLISEAKQHDISKAIVGDDLYAEMLEELTAREFNHVTNTLLLHYMYGSEYAQQAWAGTLERATESLGETLGLTVSSSTPMAPTGSTPTSTSTPASARGGRRRGAQSSRRGSSSKRTSTPSTGSTSTT